MNRGFDIRLISAALLMLLGMAIGVALSMFIVWVTVSR